MTVLSTDITYLQGVGPKKASLLNTELALYTFRDMLYYFPYKYIDKTRIYKVSEIQSTQAYVQLKGKIRTFKLSGQQHTKRLTAIFSDDTGSIELVWFKGIGYIQKNLRPGVEYIIFGKPGVFNRTLQITHPEVEAVNEIKKDEFTGLYPQYSLTEKLRNNYINSKTIARLTRQLIAKTANQISETLPDYVINENGLLTLRQALTYLHYPQNHNQLKEATYRVKFEELFYLQLGIVRLKTKRNQRFKGLVFKQVGHLFNNFYKNNLKFELTTAQKRVIKEIRKDCGSGLQMNRLLQGDVGSGKTLVALMCMLIAIDNGFQTCLMAPTEILAQQHYKTISNMLFGLNISIKLLTGSTRKKEREVIQQGLQSGQLQLIIGTHTLIEDKVQFTNLGFVVIDEQHRFGVAQRASMWKKNNIPPHMLVMTATPIPRTLAMTVYGDLDVSVIDELPPGRKPVTTAHYFDSKRLPMHGFLRKQIAAGRQVYVVYPLIKESESSDLKDLEDGYAAISDAFPPPSYTTVCVHGKMKPKEKDEAMQLFIKGKAQILVATTVIEVGVDVPNATVMVIENAERFGLSQLHQLRGRVGRGADKSYCILMSSYKLTNDAKKRLDTMVKTNDGFKIAETDLKLRGPGDMEGTQQSGLAFNLKLANLTSDTGIMERSRALAEKIISVDPELQHPKNKILSQQLLTAKNNAINWGVIS